MKQRIEEIISFPLKDNQKLLINPITGVLLHFQISKILIYSNIKFANQIPPDHILDFSAPISAIDFGSKFIYLGLENGDIVQVDNVAYSVTVLKKQTKNRIDLITASPSEHYLSIYSLDENKIGFIDLNKEKTKFHKLKYKVSHLLWLTSGKISLISEGNFYFWNIEKNKEYYKVEGHNSNITAVSRHPRSMYTVLSGDENGILKIWDFEENKIHPDLIIAFSNHKSKISIIKTSQIGEMAYSVDDKENIRLWDTSKIRKEKPIIFIKADNSITDLVPSPAQGSFISVDKNGKLSRYEGFTLENIMNAFTSYQSEIDNFMNKINNIPSWIVNNDLEVIIPNEIPILEKKLEIAGKSLTNLLSEKIDSEWERDNFSEYFKEIFELENQLISNISSIKERISNQRSAIENKSDEISHLELEIINYLEKVVEGTKISVEQLSAYFNVDQSDLLQILTKIEINRTLKFKGVIKREYVGIFFEIISNKAYQAIETDFNSVLEKNYIKCYNCGEVIQSETEIQKCPECSYENLICQTCRKYIQFNDIKISCPYCYKDYHFSCFEAKVKLFHRCPDCREMIDFNSLKQKTVGQKKEQDNIAGSLSRLVNIKSKYVKREEKDDDDDLFDF